METNNISRIIPEQSTVQSTSRGATSPQGGSPQFRPAPHAQAPVSLDIVEQLSPNSPGFASTSKSASNIYMSQPSSPTRSTRTGSNDSTSSAGDTPRLIKLVQKGDLEELQKFVQRVWNGRPDPEALQDKNGARPLHWAARKGHLHVAEWLVKQSWIDLNAQDHQGETPLHWALLPQYGPSRRHERADNRERVAEFLLQQKKIDVNLPHMQSLFSEVAFGSSKKTCELWEQAGGAETRDIDLPAIPRSCR